MYKTGWVARIHIRATPEMLADIETIQKSLPIKVTTIAIITAALKGMADGVRKGKNK